MPEDAVLALDEATPIVGTSAMAERIRAFDWGRTGLGPIREWSETLIAQVNVMLASPYPTNVAWGDDLLLIFNDESRETLGDRHEMALGRPCREVFKAIWVSPLGSDMEACYLAGATARRQNVCLFDPDDADASEHYWSYSMIPVREAGRVAGVFNLFQDVTTSVTTKLRLVRERADLDSLFQDAPAHLALFEGPEHVYKMVNRAYREMLGDRDYVGRPFAEVFPEAVKQGMVEKLDAVYRTGTSFRATGARFSVKSGPRAGQDIYSDVIYHARRDIHGTVCGIIELGSDVTGRQRVQDALIESEKVAAVGRLASSIAHEINNPLGSAVNYLYLAEMSETIDEVRKYLAIADMELKRVSAISTQTLLSQKQSTERSSVSLLAMVESILPLYQGPIWNAGIAVDATCCSEEPVLCSEGEIRQVISNLISNAVDAMQGGGRLTIRSHEGTDWATGGRVHRLTVADTGVGIAPEAATDVFKAFYTTKGFAGNGLGLWVCDQIVARHNGKLLVRSSQRQGRSGTVFMLVLPWCAAPRGAAPGQV